MLGLNVGAKRHVVTIKLPPTGLDSRGRTTGTPSIVLADVPCSIEQLSGLELIRAQKIYAEATHRVQLFADPTHPLTSKHFLVWGSRILHVGAVIDADNIGVEVELVCKEEL